MRSRASLDGMSKTQKRTYFRCKLPTYACYRGLKVFAKIFDFRKLRKTPEYFKSNKDNSPKLSQPSARKNSSVSYSQAVKQTSVKITDPLKRVMIEIIQKPIISLSELIQAIAGLTCSREFFSYNFIWSERPFDLCMSRTSIVRDFVLNTKLKIQTVVSNFPRIV